MNTTPDQDPWDHIHDSDRELPDDRGPSVCTVICIIVGTVVTLAAACYGFYRIACGLLNLAP
jgi:hypothetical protein